MHKTFWDLLVELERCGICDELGPVDLEKLEPQFKTYMDVLAKLETFTTTISNLKPEMTHTGFKATIFFVFSKLPAVGEPRTMDPPGLLSRRRAFCEAQNLGYIVKLYRTLYSMCSVGKISKNQCFRVFHPAIHDMAMMYDALDVNVTVSRSTMPERWDPRGYMASLPRKTEAAVGVNLYEIVQIDLADKAIYAFSNKCETAKAEDSEEGRRDAFMAMNGAMEKAVAHDPALIEALKEASFPDTCEAGVVPPVVREYRNILIALREKRWESGSYESGKPGWDYHLE